MRTSSLYRSQSVILHGEPATKNNSKRCISLINLSKLSILDNNVLSNPVEKLAKTDGFSFKEQQDCFSFKRQCCFQQDKSIENINAKDYVYLGSVSKSLFNQTGLSLDKEGNLLFVKGRRADLFMGMYQKYIKTPSYLTCSVVLNNKMISMKFNALVINKKGELIAIEKKTKQPYRLFFQNSEEKDPNEMTIMLCKASEEKGIENDLTFTCLNDNKSTFCSFYITQGKLYFKKCYLDDHHNYNQTYYRINLPLKKQWQINSIKKTLHVLQLEIKNKLVNKTRIFYLDPLYINFEKQKAKWLSHKPPQNLISGLGNDPHESYYSGLPFSSTRAGNFSSQYIPLLSSSVDKFRMSLKRAKPLYYRGQHGKCVKEIARSIDPGFEHFIRKLRDHFFTSCTIDTNLEQKKHIYAEHKINLIHNAKEIIHNLAENTAYISREDRLSQVIQRIMVNLNDNDTLIFNSIDQFSLFFGVAAGGIPFAPGWFAGVLVLLKKHYQLAITKKKANLGFQFIYKADKSLIPLVGTGQGLEDNGSFFKTVGVDLMTVLPIEANLILIANLVSGSSFGFELKKKDANEFIEVLLDNEKYSWLEDHIIDETKVEFYKENNLIMCIEAKSEWRGEVGFMANSHTYLVLPRTALGIRLALQLIRIQQQQKETISADNRVEKCKPGLTISLFSCDADFFEEAKIMPIPMQSGYMGTENPWCFPLPLQEEYNKIVGYQSISHQFNTSVQKTMTTSTIHHDIRIEPKKLPPKLLSLIDVLYPIFSEKKAEDIFYRQSVPPKLKEIKLFPKIDKSHDVGHYTLDTLCNPPYDYWYLNNMIVSIELLVANSNRYSLHKRSTIDAVCTYEMIASGFDKLKQQFFENLYTVELKTKNRGIMSLDKPFTHEINELKKIKSLLENSTYNHNKPLFFLKKVDITRHGYADKKFETMKLGILTAQQICRIELAQSIGTIELDCDNQANNILVKRCLLKEF